MSGYTGWGALIHRPLNTSTPFTVEAFVHVGAQRSGSYRGRISVSALPDWHGAYRFLLWFDKDGIIRGADNFVLGPYVPERWYKVAVGYERVNPSTIRLRYSINGALVGIKTVANAADESLAYLTLESGDGTVWFDDVTVTHQIFESRQLRLEIGSDSYSRLFAAPVYCARSRAWLQRRGDRSDNWRCPRGSTLGYMGETRSGV